MLIKRFDKVERREGSCWEWTREERVGNERIFVDQSKVWRLEITRDNVAERRPAMGRGKRVNEWGRS